MIFYETPYALSCLRHLKNLLEPISNITSGIALAFFWKEPEDQRHCCRCQSDACISESVFVELVRDISFCSIPFQLKYISPQIFQKKTSMIKSSLCNCILKESLASIYKKTNDETVLFAASNLNSGPWRAPRWNKRRAACGECSTGRRRPESASVLIAWAALRCLPGAPWPRRRHRRPWLFRRVFWEPARWNKVRRAKLGYRVPPTFVNG